MVDTLIVGGGTAGCVLAARLSADPAHTVVLAEAGPALRRLPAELLDATHMPIGPESPWLWRYSVELAPGVAGNIVRGRVIGGSSAVNGSYFVRATAADFAAWSSEIGTAGWSFDNILAAYVRAERDLDYGDQPGHGAAGPIPVGRMADPVPLSAEFAEACRVAGFPEIPDLNAPTAPAYGIAPVPCNVEHGRRIGTGSSYLRPALERPNLALTGGMLVTRIRFHGSRAVGVECLRDGRAETVMADRIVLCAGAVESAALLLRSGIGNPEHLRALGIPVVHAAPVGAAFFDHPEIGLEYRRESGHIVSATVPLEYVLELDDVEIRPYTVSFTPGLHRVGVALMRPRSTGTLRLRSADPTEPPHIAYGYLGDQQDWIRLSEAANTATEVLHRMSGVHVENPPPGARTTDWLRANLATSQHLSGTCRMGADDTRAVVDESCRVHGVSGLSVVDLSVVPVPLSRGPQATAVAIAEHAANLRTF